MKSRDHDNFLKLMALAYLCADIQLLHFIWNNPWTDLQWRTNEIHLSLKVFVWYRQFNQNHLLCYVESHRAVAYK